MYTEFCSLGDDLQNDCNFTCALALASTCLCTVCCTEILLQSFLLPLVWPNKVCVCLSYLFGPPLRAAEVSCPPQYTSLLSAQNGKSSISSMTCTQTDPCPTCQTSCKLVLYVYFRQHRFLIFSRIFSKYTAGLSVTSTENGVNTIIRLSRVPSIDHTMLVSTKHRSHNGGVNTIIGLSCVPSIDHTMSVSTQSSGSHVYQG